MLLLENKKETDIALDVGNVLFKNKPNLINSFMHVHQSWADHYTDEMDIIDIHSNT